MMLQKQEIIATRTIIKKKAQKKSTSVCDYLFGIDTKILEEHNPSVLLLVNHLYAHGSFEFFPKMLILMLMFYFQQNPPTWTSECLHYSCSQRIFSRHEMSYAFGLANDESRKIYKADILTAPTRRTKALRDTTAEKSQTA